MEKLQLLTAKDVAEMFQVKIRTIRQWTYDGILKPVTIPGIRSVRYRSEDIQKLLK